MKIIITILFLASLGLATSCKKDPSKSIKKIGDTTIESKVIFGKVHNLAAADFKKAISLEGATLIDVRTPKEFTGAKGASDGHIEGAIMVDWYKRSFQNYILNIPLDKPILIYCRTGNRTSKTAAALQSLGFKNIYNLDKGIKDWKAVNLPFVKGDTQANKIFQEQMTTSTNDVEAAIAKVMKGGMKIYHVNNKDFQEAMKLNGATIVDARTPQEYAASHIKDVNININWEKRTFKEKIEQFDKSKPILIYCRTGNRTSKTASAMQAMGFKEVYNLEKGIKNWQEAGFPTYVANKG